MATIIQLYRTYYNKVTRPKNHKVDVLLRNSVKGTLKRTAIQTLIWTNEVEQTYLGRNYRRAFVKLYQTLIKHGFPWG